MVGRSLRQRQSCLGFVPEERNETITKGAPLSYCVYSLQYYWQTLAAVVAVIRQLPQPLLRKGFDFYKHLAPMERRNSGKADCREMEKRVRSQEGGSSPLSSLISCSSFFSSSRILRCISPSRRKAAVDLN